MTVQWVATVTRARSGADQDTCKVLISLDASSGFEVRLSVQHPDIPDVPGVYTLVDPRALCYPPFPPLAIEREAAAVLSLPHPAPDSPVCLVLKEGPLSAFIPIPAAVCAWAYQLLDEDDKREPEAVDCD